MGVGALAIENYEVLEKELQARLSSIREELQKLILDRDALRSELKKTREMINSKRGTLDKLKNELKSIGGELSSLYQSLNQLKSELGNLRESLRLNIEQVKQISSTIKRRNVNAGRESIDSIKEEIERLEWILITTPNLDLEEEKRIVEKISQLEKRLKELTSHQKDAVELYFQYKEINATIENLRKEIKKKLDEIGKVREKIKQLKGVREKTKKELLGVLGDIVELKRKRDELKNRLSEIKSAIDGKSEEYRGIVKDLNRLKELKEKSKTTALLERKREEVKGKMARGERITIHELYIAFSNEESR